MTKIFNVAKMSKAEREEAIALVTPMISRRERARRDIVALIAERGFDAATAEKIAALYIAEKIVRYDGNSYIVKHGAFWDAEVLQRAAAS